MSFQTKQIRGKGRGKFLGFPTINMEIPPEFTVAEGVYAVRVRLNNKVFFGAMHYGPIPTFHQSDKQLEVFLLDVSEAQAKLLNTSVIQITPLERIRAVRTFSSSEKLIAQMKKDISAIGRIVSQETAV